MFKVLIADDEPMIREGLRDFVEWEKFGMKPVALAENGRQAMELIEIHCPDVCVLDIKMPLADGLEVSEYYKALNPDGIAIFFTGHDEFEYALRALRAHAFDFIKKPLDMGELSSVLKRAKITLGEREAAGSKLNHALSQIDDNFSLLRDSFVLRCLERDLEPDELEKGLKLYRLDFPAPCGLILVKIRDGLGPLKPFSLTGSAARTEAALSGFERVYVLSKAPDRILALVSISDRDLWAELEQTLADNLAETADIKAAAVFEEYGAPRELRAGYERAAGRLERLGLVSPLIQAFLEHIHSNYGDSELSLSSFAELHNVSSSYLSRLFKREINQSYSAYLSDFRVGRSLGCLREPRLKINEIARLVGFSNQYYFCQTFKRCMGVSPSAYRGKTMGTDGGENES